MRCSRKAVGVLVTVLAMLGTSFAPAFGVAGTNYVALGDSYASGVGTRDYFDENDGCYRGPKAYPPLWANHHDVSSFAFPACAGDTTDDLNAHQLDALSARTTLVTVTIGGNDVGFSDVIRTCLLGDEDLCDRAVAKREDQAREELPTKLDASYDKIAAAAPNARVVVLSYPRLNGPGECGIPGYSERKRQRMNDGVDVLTEITQQHAATAGFTFADVRDEFAGHGVCDGQEWINGPSNPRRESFHPNVDGQAHGYLPAVNAVTG